MCALSGMAVTLFLGGWHAPLPALEFIPSYAWFAAKLLALLLGFIWIRATMPRLRIDQLTRLAWKFLVPLALVNLGTAAFWSLTFPWAGPLQLVRWAVAIALVVGPVPPPGPRADVRPRPPHLPLRMNAVLVLIALATVGTAAAAMSRRNLLHSVLLLAGSWTGVAAFYLWAGAEFAAFAQVLVYVGRHLDGRPLRRPADAALARRLPAGAGLAEPRGSTPSCAGAAVAAVLLAAVARRPARGRPRRPRLPSPCASSAASSWGRTPRPCSWSGCCSRSRSSARSSSPPAARPKATGGHAMSPLQLCLAFSSVLFAVGLAGALARSNSILVLLGIELMLNAANLNFIAFWRFGPRGVARHRRHLRHLRDRGRGRRDRGRPRARDRDLPPPAGTSACRRRPA